MNRSSNVSHFKKQWSASSRISTSSKTCGVPLKYSSGFVAENALLAGNGANSDSHDGIYLSLAVLQFNAQRPAELRVAPYSRCRGLLSNYCPGVVAEFTSPACSAASAANSSILTNRSLNGSQSRIHGLVGLRISTSKTCSAPPKCSSGWGRKRLCSLATVRETIRTMVYIVRQRVLSLSCSDPQLGA